MTTSTKTKLFTRTIYLMAFVCIIIIIVSVMGPTPVAINFLMYTVSFISIGFVGITLYLAGP